METEIRLYRKIARAWNVILLGLLIFIPSALIYMTIETAEFIRNCPDDSCKSWIGILYFILIPGEIYLVLIYCWLWRLRKIKLNAMWHMIQLMIIFLLGIIPGLLMTYPLIFK